MFEFVYYKGTYQHNGGGYKRERLGVMRSMGKAMAILWDRGAAALSQAGG